MNEKIKELAKQADCSIDSFGLGGGDLQKFYHLIVLECIKAIEEGDGSEIYVENIKERMS